MKRIVIVLMCLFAIAPTLLAQEKNKEEVKIVLVKEESSDNHYYEGVVPVEGVTKEEMFKRAKQWILANLKTSDNNIQFNEQDLSIVNTGSLLLTAEKKALTGRYSHGVCNFKLNLWFKEGKFKFRIDNVIIYAEWNTTWKETKSYEYYLTKRAGPYKRLVNDVNKELYNLSFQVERAIKGDNKSTNDW